MFVNGVLLFLRSRVKSRKADVLQDSSDAIALAEMTLRWALGSRSLNYF